MSKIGFNVVVSETTKGEKRNTCVSIESLSTVRYNSLNDKTIIRGTDGLTLGGVICPTFTDARSAAVEIATGLSTLRGYEIPVEFWYEPDNAVITLCVAKNGKVTKQ